MCGPLGQVLFSFFYKETDTINMLLLLKLYCKKNNNSRAVINARLTVYLNMGNKGCEVNWRFHGLAKWVTVSHLWKAEFIKMQAGCCRSFRYF